MIEMKTTRIDAKGIHYTPLNQKIRAAIADGAGEIILDNVLGQRLDVYKRQGWWGGAHP